MYGLRCLNLCNLGQNKIFKMKKKCNFYLRKKHFHNFRENQILRFFQKLVKFAKINSLKVVACYKRDDELLCRLKCALQVSICIVKLLGK